METERLHIRLAHCFSGEHASIVQMLDGLAVLLDGEAADNPPRDGAGAAAASRAHYVDLILRQYMVFTYSFERANAVFEAAAQRTGAITEYAAAYGKCLGNLQFAADAVRRVRAPESLPETQDTFRSMLQSSLQQLRSWPEKLREVARGVHGSSFELALDVDAELNPFYEALRKETDGQFDLGKPPTAHYSAKEELPSKMFFHPWTPPEVILDAILAKAKDLRPIED
jgi:hypothetical protein